MCLSSSLAQVIGIFAFLLSLAMLSHHDRYKKTFQELLHSPALLTMSGFIMLLLGLLVLHCNNLWVADWRLLITLIGWFLVIQGVLRLFLMERFMKWGKSFLNSKAFLISRWIWLIIGIYLIWIGFANG